MNTPMFQAVFLVVMLASVPAVAAATLSIPDYALGYDEPQFVTSPRDDKGEDVRDFRFYVFQVEGYLGTHNGEDFPTFGPWGVDARFALMSTRVDLNAFRGRDRDDLNVDEWLKKLSGNVFGVGLDTYGFRGAGNDAVRRWNVSYAGMFYALLIGVEYGEVVWDDGHRSSSYAAFSLGPILQGGDGWSLNLRSKLGFFILRGGGISFESRITYGYALTENVTFAAGFDWGTFHINAVGTDFKEVFARLLFTVTIHFLWLG